jgi:PAT family acetyl-CoA transporter-like MFS transporter 1
MPTATGDSFLYHIVQPDVQEPSLLLTHQQDTRIELEPWNGEPQQAGIYIQKTDFKTEEGEVADKPSRSRSHTSLPHISTANPDGEDDPVLTHPSDIGFDSDDSQMGRKAQPSSLRKRDPTPSTSLGGSNGHANGNMAHHLEMRRKHASLESPTGATQTAALMGRESFNLDDEPPLTPITPNPNSSFFDLPLQDRRNFLLLVLLYFLQGIPMGLASGSVPFLLKPHLSYGQIGVFSLASYPYSLKLLWSPIVDAVWSPKLGRRKSWIMPIQVCSGLGMIYLGGRVKDMMVAAGASDGSGVWLFTWWWFFLVFLCATQDIAVDGWALTLLSPQNLSYASTAQTVGLTAGHFLSYTVFLAFNSPDFANRWFRSSPRPEGVMTLGGYLTFAGWAYLIVTAGLATLKREDKTKERDGIMEVYRSMLGVLKLKNIQSIIVIHLIAKIGFQANDAVTNLKLLDKGFSQEDLALTVLIDFPFEISLGYYAGRWSTSNPPIHVWCYAFIGRLVAACLAQLVVMIFPADGVQPWYLLTVILSHIFSTFTSTVMFVAISAFHAKIADPLIGGTYMTLLATYVPIFLLPHFQFFLRALTNNVSSVSNLGGTFPRFFILKLVDYFTVATCHPGEIIPKGASEIITSPFSCVAEAEKHRCTNGGGTCTIERDGYYITNVVCVLIGAITFAMYIRPAAMKLQALPLRAWRLSGEPR